MNGPQNALYQNGTNGYASTNRRPPELKIEKSLNNIS